jgi:hypothetical protein
LPAWWEPAAVTTCMASVSMPAAFCDLQRLGDLFNNWELQEAKTSRDS